MESNRSALMYDFSTHSQLESADGDPLNAEDASGFAFTPFVESLFEPLPKWQQTCIIWVLVVLGWILNSVVIKIYWRIKSCSRKYVLAMTFIDLVCLNFALLPRFFLWYQATSPLALYPPAKSPLHFPPGWFPPEKYPPWTFLP